QVYGDAGEGEEHRLRHQQDARRVPEPVEGSQHEEDGVEVVSEQVRDSEDGVGEHLELAVAPDGLVLDAEVEGVAAEVVVTEQADPGVQHRGHQGQPGGGQGGRRRDGKCMAPLGPNRSHHSRHTATPRSDPPGPRYPASERWPPALYPSAWETSPKLYSVRPAPA